MDLHKNLVTDVSLDWEVSVKFRKCSRSGIWIRTLDPHGTCFGRGLRSLGAVVVISSVSINRKIQRESYGEYVYFI